MQYTTHYESPLGGITLASDGNALTGLWFDGQKYFADTLDKEHETAELPVFDATRRWLDAFFSGTEPSFTPPLRMIASPFRKRVWESLLRIPYGKTTTYSAIAQEIAAERGQKSMSAQAVGGAVGHNSISLIIPCHRVVGANGSLTGYAGGIDRKIKLLQLEHAMNKQPLHDHTADDKAKAYRQIIPQIEAMIEGVDNHVGALANVAAALKDAFGYYLWVGFYVVKGDELALGPFQGPVACYSIKKGKGVCGAAWEKEQTIIVADVEQFPGHIACSSKSRSEIVVPVFNDKEVKAVIDVDSADLGAFDEKDKEGLEKIAEIISPLLQ